MTREIARIVGGILASDRFFLVGDGELWLPFAEDVFDVSPHIRKGLQLHGYKAAGGTREFSGLKISVNEAEEIPNEAVKGVLSETFGYKGRVVGLSERKPNSDAPSIEPGNILEIPHIGWVGEECRVVIGRYDGLYLAKLHTPKVEVYKGDSLKIVHGPNEGGRTTLNELVSNHQVIVKRPEWMGYPQQAYR